MHCQSTLAPPHPALDFGSSTHSRASHRPVCTISSHFKVPAAQTLCLCGSISLNNSGCTALCNIIIVLRQQALRPADKPSLPPPGRLPLGMSTACLSTWLSILTCGLVRCGQQKEEQEHEAFAPLLGSPCKRGRRVCTWKRCLILLLRPTASARLINQL